MAAEKPVPAAVPLPAAAVPDRLVCRPRKLILSSAAASGVLVLVSLIGWYALPRKLQVQFEFSQIVTLLILLALLVVGVVIIASSNVKADARGVRFRNGLGYHRLEWDQIHRFLLRPGDAWAIVLIRPEDRAFEEAMDAEKYQLMGIQAGDGALAKDHLDTLRAMQRRFGTKPAMPVGRKTRPSAPRQEFGT